MGRVNRDVCDYCGAKVETGIQSEHCAHRVCSNCIVLRGINPSCVSEQKTLLCPVCGADTGVCFDVIMHWMQERVCNISLPSLK